MTDYDYENKAVEAVKFIAANFNEKAVEDAIFDALINEHRTLQQSFWRIMKQVIHRYADLDPQYYMDARNEASREFCRRISMNEPNASLVGLPVI